MRQVPAANEVQFGRPPGGAAVYEGNRFREGGPVRGRGGRRSECGDGLQRVGGIHDQIEKSPRGRRAGSGQELDDAKAGSAVARVLGPAQKCQNVLDVRGF